MKKKHVKAGDWVITIILTVISLMCLLPILNILARSLSSSEALVRNEVFLLPKGFNIDAYVTVLEDAKYTWSLAWTAILTIICTLVSLAMTILCAYPMIYDKLKGRGIFNLIIIFTMFFNAGTIPNYLLMKALGILNKPIVLIIPSCLSVFNMIIMRSFFYGIPESLRESAEIDGGSYVQILFKIYLPLSKPVIATLALFYAVSRWNGFSDALMYMNNRFYYPLQLLLYNILNNINSIEVSTQEGFASPGLTISLKMATVMFTTIPIILIYPWLQNYFISGVTLGAVKE